MKLLALTFTGWSAYFRGWLAAPSGWRRGWPRRPIGQFQRSAHIKRVKLFVCFVGLCGIEPLTVRSRLYQRRFPEETTFLQVRAEIYSKLLQTALDISRADLRTSLNCRQQYSTR